MSQFNVMTANLGNLSQVPWLRQILLMVGIAVSVAVGVATVMWSQGPTYKVLYSTLAPEQAVSVVDTLTSLNIPYQTNEATGGISVPADRLHEARLKLAGNGVVVSDGTGLEIMNEAKGFGVSEFMETKRYQHALETELARTVESMQQVRKARVHLALPKQSVFVRDRKPASASIFLDMFPGAQINREQVAAIVNLVAGSIPDLNPEQVTVVDQQGNLLSQQMDDPLSVGARQLEFRQRIERSYEQRIEQLLAPIVASGNVKVQVAADIDFTKSETSRESWNPEAQVVRSEQINVSNKPNDPNAGAMGLAGALSNQPPMSNPRVNGENPATGPDTAAAAGNAAATATGSSSVVRNYEIERTLNYSQSPATSTKRLSVAVIVDSQPEKDAEGKIVRAAPNDAELARLTQIVQNAVGFVQERGDVVTVMSAAFAAQGEGEASSGPAFWELPWFADALRQVLAGVAVLLLVLLVLRPAMKNLMSGAKPALPVGGAEGAVAGAIGADGLALPPGSANNSSQAQAGSVPGQPLMIGQDLNPKVDFVRSAAAEDPRRVAQVVKSWVNTSDT